MFIHENGPKTPSAPHTKPQARENTKVLRQDLLDELQELGGDALRYADLPFPEVSELSERTLQSGLLALLLGTRTLLGAPGIATRNKDATNGAFSVGMGLRLGVGRLDGRAASQLGSYERSVLSS